MTKKQRIATTIRLEEQDREAIAAIKEHYGVASDSDAIRLALRKVLREIKRQILPTLPQ
jgi:Arc/MetJ family transcription regulator